MTEWKRHCEPVRARQSTSYKWGHDAKVDCFVAHAPRNDGEMKNGGAFPVIASPLGRGNPHHTSGDMMRKWIASSLLLLAMTER